MTVTLPSAASAAVDAQIHDEQVAQLYQQSATTITASTAVAALLLMLLAWRVPAGHLLAWGAVFVAVTIARGLTVALYWKRRRAADTAAWERFFVIGCAAAGASWGLCALWLFPSAAVDYQLFIAIIGLGLAAGAANSLSSVLSAYLCFVLPAAVPMAVRILAEPTMLTRVAGGMALIFCGAMVMIARANNRLIRNSLRLRFANVELARELELLATRDPLTGLPNRLILAERLDRALRRANRSDHDVAVVFVDCDRFKTVNDTFGHRTGDEFLRHVGASLSSAVRDVDTVARLGGDEFIILLEQCGEKNQVMRIVERIFSIACKPAQIAGHEMRPSLSVGVACYPGDGTDAETLIKQADEAMYAAKARGGHRYRFFASPNESQIALSS